MKKWSEQAEAELKKLNFQQLTDKAVANILNQAGEQWSFTSTAVKRKRHRLRLFKKTSPIINDSTFYVKVSKKKKGLGFYPIHMPLHYIKRYGIKDNDVLILRKNDKLFLTKVTKIIRKDRPNDNCICYIPYNLVVSTRFNEEIIEYIGKVEKYKKKYKLLSKTKLDILALLQNKINEKIQISLHPFDNNKILISNGRASIPIELLRCVKLSEQLFQCLGFFQGEGTKVHSRRIEIVNANPDLLNMFVGLLRNSFGINNGQWRARLVYTKQRKDAMLEKELIKYWSKKIEIPENNFVKSKWVRGNPDAPRGSLQLYLNSASLREVWFCSLNLTYKIVKENKHYAKWFLQGIVAADGCSTFRRGVLDKVMIRIENQSEGELYQSALRKLGIFSTLSVKNRSVTVNRFNEMQKVYRYELFKLHKERNVKFKKGLLERAERRQK